MKKKDQKKKDEKENVKNIVYLPGKNSTSIYLLKCVAEGAPKLLISCVSLCVFFRKPVCF